MKNDPSDLKLTSWEKVKLTVLWSLAIMTAAGIVALINVKADFRF